MIGHVVAVTAHATWNASAFFRGGGAFVLTYVFAMVPAFLLLVGFAVWARRREGAMLTQSLSDCAQRGYLGAPRCRGWCGSPRGARASATPASMVVRSPRG